ncbi:MAG: TetR/AcrR family transcriptional regulator [Coriobacteriales bacterium]|nr:TetR/AcrR family transcriptional regulator [Coriobacteriales bacterium]
MPQPECLDLLDKRRALMAILLEELQEKPLDKIKAADLYAHCGISRASFYRCFAGVRDIGAWYQRYTSEIGLHQIGLTLTCMQGHRISLELIMRAQSLYSNYPNRWNDFSLSAINSQVEAMEQVYKLRKLPVDNRIRYIFEGVSYSAHHTVGNWISRGIDLPIADIVNVIISFYPKELRKILDDPIKPQDNTSLIEQLLLA